MDDATEPSRLRALTRDDGLELRYRVWPRPTKERATVLLLNGIMSHSAWFEPLSAGLAAAGFALVGADRRGSGPNPQGRGDAPSAGVLVDDALAIADAEAGEGPLLVVGWCWGAALGVALAAKLAARQPRSIEGLVLVTPGMFNHPELHEAIAAQKDTIASAAQDAAVIDSPIREEMFTAGPALDEFVRADPLRAKTMTPRMLAVTGKLATAAGIRLRKLSLPTLVVLAKDDEATDNEATRKFFAKLSSPAVSLADVPGRHGVQFDAPEATVQHIVEWAATVLPR